MRLSLKEFQIEYMRYMEDPSRKDLSKEILSKAFFKINHRKLPEFFSNRFQYLDFSKHQCYEHSNVIQKEIDIRSIYGDSWLFQDFDSLYEEFPSRPLPERLAMLFCRNSDRIVEPVPLLDLGNGKYAANDGNHRIYSAYLRGWQTVPARIEGKL